MKRYRFSANNVIEYYHTSRIFNKFIVSWDIYRFNKKKKLTNKTFPLNNPPITGHVILFLDIQQQWKRPRRIGRFCAAKYKIQII